MNRYNDVLLNNNEGKNGDSFTNDIRGEVEATTAANILIASLSIQ